MSALVLVRALTDLVLPRECAGCRRPGTLLCPPCRGAATGPVAIGGLAVCAAGGYAGGLRTALLAYKERGRQELAGPLAELLADAVRALASLPSPLPADSCLVPVPSSRRARRQRGGDHVLRLARGAGRSCGLPVVAALRLTRGVADSAGLTREQRAANLSGALVAAPGGGRAAVLVDDIVTTGATLREAARALGAAGWPVAAAAVVATTGRREGHAAHT